jgi:hypothetical protein
MNLLEDTFPMSYHAPQMKIVCQSYAPEKLIHQTTQNRVHKTVGFSSSEVRVLDLFMLKIPLEPHCNHIISNVSIHHISSQRLVATILVSLSLCISTVLYISLINRNCVLLYLYVYGCIYDMFLLYYFISDISLYISLLYLRSHFVPKII